MTGLGLAVLLASAAAAAPPNTIVSAEYAEPTTRYAHGILGDAIEHGALSLRIDCDGCARPRDVLIRLPDTHVFEDVAPRIVDIDGDSLNEVMVVETSMALGARLAIYDETGVVAAIPYIGRTHRWLAPIGAADMDGDGRVEVAYVDRPHLAKTLRVWQFRDGELVLVAEKSGLTNHRIGERDIGGGLRVCGGVTEMITASADWTQVVATRLQNGQLVSRVVGPHRDRGSLADAQRC
jgi:hypothetical protein